MACSRLRAGRQSWVQIQTVSLTIYDLDSSRRLSPHKEKVLTHRGVGRIKRHNPVIPFPSSVSLLPAHTLSLAYLDYRQQLS